MFGREKSILDTSPFERVAPVYVGVSRIIWCIAHTIGLILPLFIIGLPIWADTMFIFVCQIPFINILLCLVLWIWGLVIVIGNPITWLSIIYFVLFSGASLFLVIGFIISEIKFNYTYNR